MIIYKPKTLERRMLALKECAKMSNYDIINFPIKVGFEGDLTQIQYMMKPEVCYTFSKRDISGVRIWANNNIYKLLMERW